MADRVTGHSLLLPGAHRAEDVTGDAALVRSMVSVELAWFAALLDAGLVTAEQHAAVATAADRIGLDQLDPVAVEAAGNPVLPLVKALRACIGDPNLTATLHRGLTSQDVLDTALMLMLASTRTSVRADLLTVATALAGLAERYRDAVMAGRTLTQHAVPITFGLKSAQWLVAVLDADVRLEVLALPVQVGGAAGTLSKASQSVTDLGRAVEVVADRLGLDVPDLPWHTRRAPVTRAGDALVEACDVLGSIASEILLLGRPEIDELREGGAPGRGQSSTMPQKRNPVLAVLVRSAALQAPLLGAQLHACAAQAIEERPDGAWHAEWPALRQLMRITVTAAAQAAELVSHLVVHRDVMEERARAAAAVLLAERGGEGPADLASYLGQADAFVDRALALFRSFRERSDG